MKFSRRRFFGSGVALSTALVSPFGTGCSDASDDGPPAFMHGVASGDPLPEAVILWTRVMPDGQAEVSVDWEIATDIAFAQVVGRGTAKATADHDFTVKVDATGLTPGTTYFYRFRARGKTSPVGRTKTAPRGANIHARFGVVACASFAQGYFHVYRLLARRADLDAVIHLGDYIYEYGGTDDGEVRTYEPNHEILTLEDYRARYAQYRRDKDLQAVHQQHPFIAVWDDHEFANNAYKDGAGNHTPGAEGDWNARKAVAAQVYFEWMPIREQGDRKIFRSLAYGDLAELIMLDTRIWGRDAQVSGNSPDVNSDTRTLLGADQEAWFDDRLKTSKAQWKVVGQQVMMGQLPQFPNGDSWDGYAKSRERFFNVLQQNKIKDVVVITGDIHTSWALDLTLDPKSAAYDPATGAGAFAVEFITPGVTSPGLPGLGGLEAGLLKDNRHMRYTDITRRGYFVLDLTVDRAQAVFFHIPGVDMVDLPAEEMSGAYATRKGVSNVQADPLPALGADGPPLAPT